VQFADLGEHKAQRLVSCNLFNVIDPLDGAPVVDVASVGVDGVGGVNDDATLLQHLSGLLDEPLLRVLFVDDENHGLSTVRRLWPPP
jgi:hypothetical protein